MVDQTFFDTKEKQESNMIKHYNESLQLLSHAKYNEGIERLQILLCNKLIESDEFFQLKMSIYSSLASAYEANGDYNKSLFYLHKHVKQNPSDYRTWQKMAKLCRLQGYFSQARLCYQHCLTHSPGVPYDKIIQELMTHISFFMDDAYGLLSQCDFLIAHDYKTSEMLQMKMHAYYLLNQREQSEICQKLQENYQKSRGFGNALSLTQEYVNSLKEERTRILDRHSQILVTRASLSETVNTQPQIVVEIKQDTQKLSGWGAFFKQFKCIQKAFLVIGANDKKIKTNKDMDNYAKQMVGASLACSPILIKRMQVQVQTNQQLQQQQGNKNKNKRKILTQDANTWLSPVKHSTRLQKAGDIKVRIGFEALAREVAEQRKQVSLEEIVNDFQSDFLSKIEAGLDLNLIIESEQNVNGNFDKYLKGFIKQSVSNEDQNQNLPVAQAVQVQAAMEIEGEDDSQQELHQLFIKDFENFMFQNGNEQISFCNAVVMLVEIVCHFTRGNQSMDYLSRIPKNKYFSVYADSLKFAPSPQLQEQQIKLTICKYIMFIHENTLLTGDFFQNNGNGDSAFISMQVTHFELLLDYLQMLKEELEGHINHKSALQHQPTHELIDSETNEIKQIQEEISKVSHVLNKIADGFLFFDGIPQSNNNHELNINLQARAFRALSMHFTLCQDFRNFAKAHWCLERLKSILSRNQIRINLFWLDPRNASDVCVLDESFLEEFEKILFEVELDTRNKDKDKTSALSQADVNRMDRVLTKYLSDFQAQLAIKSASFYGALSQELQTEYQKIIANIKLLKLAYPQLSFKHFLSIMRLLNQTVMSQGAETTLNPMTQAYDLSYHSSLICGVQETFKMEIIMKELVSALRLYSELLQQTDQKADFTKESTQNVMLMEAPLLFYLLNAFVKCMRIAISLSSTSISANKNDNQNEKQLSAKQSNQILECHLFRFCHIIMDLSAEEEIVRIHEQLFSQRFRSQIMMGMLDCIEKQHEIKTENSSTNVTLEDILDDEVCRYFLCYYHIIPHKGKVDSLHSSCAMKGRTPQVTTLEEVLLGVRYIQLYAPEYNQYNSSSGSGHTNHIRMKPQTVAFLQKSFDILYACDDQWNTCEQLRCVIKDHLRIALSLLPNSLQSLEHIFKRTKEGALLRKECFCDKKNCFSSNTVDFLLKNGFYLIGKSLEDVSCKAIASETKDFIRNRLIKDQLKKAYKMYEINACLNPFRFNSWLVLAKVSLHLTCFYWDQMVYDAVPKTYVGLKSCHQTTLEVIKIGFSKFINMHNDSHQIVMYSKQIELLEYKMLICLSLFYKNRTQTILKTKPSIMLTNERAAILQILSAQIPFDYSRFSDRHLLEQSQINQCVRLAVMKLFYVVHKFNFKFSCNDNIGHLSSILSLKELISGQFADMGFRGENYDVECDLNVLKHVWKQIKKYYIVYQWALLQEQNLNSEQENIDKEKIFAIMNENLNYQNNQNQNLFLKIIVECIETDFNQYMSLLEGTVKLDDVYNINQVKAHQNEFHQQQNAIDNQQLSFTNLDISILLQDNRKTLKFEQVIISILKQHLKQACQNNQHNEQSNNFSNDNEKRIEAMSRLAKSVLQKLFFVMTKNKTKIKGRNVHTQILYYISKIQSQLSANDKQQAALRSSEDIVKVGTSELTELYKSERDPILSIFLHRNVVFMIQRYKLCQLRCNIVAKCSEINKLRHLCRRVQKNIYVQEEDGKERTIMIYLHLFAHCLSQYVHCLRALLTILKGEKHGLMISNPTASNTYEEVLNIACTINKKWFFELIGDVCKKKNLHESLCKLESYAGLVRECGDLIILGHLYYADIIQVGTPVQANETNTQNNGIDVDINLDVSPPKVNQEDEIQKIHQEYLHQLEEAIKYFEAIYKKKKANKLQQFQVKTNPTNNQIQNTNQTMPISNQNLNDDDIILIEDDCDNI